MPKVIEIGLGATIALPGYNSVRVDYRETATVQDGEDLAAAREKLYDSVDAYIDLKVQEIKKESNG